MTKGRTDGQPIVGAGHVFSSKWNAIAHPYGGFGTFFNKEAIKSMVSPICTDQPKEETSCSNLHQNRIGELDVYQPGDSVFDLFYKFSALQQYCLHSDWMMGYIVTYLLDISFLVATENSITDCTENSMTCHWQTPSDMKRLNGISSTLLDNSSVFYPPHYLPLISSNVSFFCTRLVVFYLFTCL